MNINIGDSFIYNAKPSGVVYKYVVWSISNLDIGLQMYTFQTPYNPTEFEGINMQPFKTTHNLQTFIDAISSGAIVRIYDIENINPNLDLRNETI